MYRNRDPDRNLYPTHASIKKQMKSLNLTGVCQFENFANTVLGLQLEFFLQTLNNCLNF